jgi:glutamine synthetase
MEDFYIDGACMGALENLLKEKQVQFVDLRFTDIGGKEQHITIKSNIVDNEFLQEGKYFDGSSIAGWCSIDRSDMVLKPRPETAVMDPFALDPTLILRCDVYDPRANIPYDRCPRSIAKKAQEYLKASGIADEAFFGPEPEFFVFDDVRFGVDMQGAFYSIDSQEAAWNTGKILPQGNLAHRPPVKGGYFPVSPVDSSQDLRAEMCKQMEAMGLVVEAHHHEVATANQNEICVKFNNLLTKADELQIYKYVVKNVAFAYGKTATFMPKPLVGDNGSGMHCHQSLYKEGKNLFAGDAYAGLSETALYYIGGIIKHAKALNAFTNPTTNSYRRLVPGFEAPVMLAYSACNRSASIRIPFTSAKGRRIEVRFPDPTANPYLAFSAMLLAGLDGIKNKIHPGKPEDHDLYELTDAEAQHIPRVCHSLEQALEALSEDYQFLVENSVFSEDFIKNYISMKMKEVQRLRLQTHPVEFEMYYSD